MRAFTGENLNMRVFTGVVPSIELLVQPLCIILEFCTSATAARGPFRVQPVWKREFWAGKLDMVTPGLAQARIASIKPPTPRMLIYPFHVVGQDM